MAKTVSPKNTISPSVVLMAKTTRKYHHTYAGTIGPARRPRNSWQRLAHPPCRRGRIRAADGGAQSTRWWLFGTGSTTRSSSTAMESAGARLDAPRSGSRKRPTARDRDHGDCRKGSGQTQCLSPHVLLWVRTQSPSRSAEQHRAYQNPRVLGGEQKSTATPAVSRRSSRPLDIAIESIDRRQKK